MADVAASQTLDCYFAAHVMPSRFAFGVPIPPQPRDARPGSRVFSLHPAVSAARTIGRPRRLETMPSQPKAQACVKMTAPSPSKSSLKTMLEWAPRSSLARRCLRTSMGFRRKSSPFSSSRSNAQCTALASDRCPANKLEYGEPVFIGDDSLAVDHA